jgi:hypothetical protein
MEVRWFYRGTLPPDVLAWFQQGARCSVDPSQRVDHYLRVAGGDSVGIKLREGRIEVKQRHRQAGVVRFHERVAGTVEHWRKWSFPLAGLNDCLASIAHPASGWIGVYKKRRLQRYQIMGDGNLVTISTEHYPNQGCDLELTDVRAAGLKWWTMSFEAFGDEGALRENLALATESILGIADPPVLEIEGSFGYPKWLQILESVEN